MIAIDDLSLFQTKDGKPVKGFVIGRYFRGCRLYLLNSVVGRGATDISLSNVKNLLKSGVLQLYNAQLKGNDLVGTNGSLDRYVEIYPGVAGTNKEVNLIIMAELRDGSNNLVGYRCVTSIGEVFDKPEKEITQLCNSLAQEYCNNKDYYPIANGKIVQQDGKEAHISSIKGEYNKITVQPNKKNQKATVNATVAESKDVFKAIKLATEDRKKFMGDTTTTNVSTDSIYIWLQNDKEALNTMATVLASYPTVEEKAKKIARGGGKIAIQDTGNNTINLTDRYKNWKASRRQLNIPTLAESLK